MHVLEIALTDALDVERFRRLVVLHPEVQSGTAQQARLSKNLVYLHLRVDLRQLLHGLNQLDLISLRLPVSPGAGHVVRDDVDDLPGEPIRPMHRIQLGGIDHPEAEDLADGLVLRATQAGDQAAEGVEKPH